MQQAQQAQLKSKPIKCLILKSQNLDVRVTLHVRRSCRDRASYWAIEHSGIG